jgi:hypothetical protein
MKTPKKPCVRKPAGRAFPAGHRRRPPPAKPGRCGIPAPAPRRGAAASGGVRGRPARAGPGAGVRPGRGGRWHAPRRAAGARRTAEAKGQAASLDAAFCEAGRREPRRLRSGRASTPPEERRTGYVSHEGRQRGERPDAAEGAAHNARPLCDVPRSRGCDDGGPAGRCRCSGGLFGGKARVFVEMERRGRAARSDAAPGAELVRMTGS